ncbi:MAG: aminopeptidase P family protein [Clostridia bacterium]|nr:aminopeptidase P family protein [Clostridia bacterium]
MKFSKAKLYLITDEKQRLYFTGFASSAGYVLLFPDGMTFVVDDRYSYAAKKLLASKGITVESGTGYGFLKAYAEDRKVETIGVDFTKLTVSEYERLQGEGFNLVNVADEIESVMSIKTEEELVSIAKACAIAEKSFREAVAEMRLGMSERELAAILEYRFKVNGASDKSFDTIVAFGPNSAVPHHETGETRLKNDVPVLMDFGCIYNGYCSDMTRTFYFGIPTREFVKAYDAVLAAHVKAYENIRAGMIGSEADGIARNVIFENGYSGYFTHSLGHGIGVNIHEYPWVSPKANNVLENGMVFSIEPGVYINGKFGIRIEDTEVMKNGRPQTFMTETKNLCVWSNGKLKKYGK